MIGRENQPKDRPEVFHAEAVYCQKAPIPRTECRMFAAKIVTEFKQQFGDITCSGLIGMDFSKPGEYQKFLNSGIWKNKCEKYVEFMIEKLYELEKDRGLFVMAS